MASQIPAGILAERFGGKHIYGLGVLLTGVFNLLTPIAARTSLPVLYTVRVLTGLAEVSHQILDFLFCKKNIIKRLLPFLGGNHARRDSYAC